MQFASTTKKVTVSEGNPNAKICIITGIPSWEGRPLSEPAKNLIFDVARKAGVSSNDLRFESVLGEIPQGRKAENLELGLLEHWQEDCLKRLAESPANIFVPLGDLALNTLTNHTSVDKWHLSIIEATKLANRKTVPLFHPERIFANYGEIPFLIFGFQRIAAEAQSPTIRRKPRVFHVAPTFEQAIAFLGRCLFSDELSIDIETADGQITCVGFASSPTEAMCIPTLQSNWTYNEFYKIWEWIKDVLEGPSKKVFQNFIYDCSYFSRYGIRVRNLWHDTMLAQKFLFPELPMGLDTIARLYTQEPYWKDEGKDWKKVGDLKTFWTYNCKDVAITLEAAHEQLKDLKSRNLYEPFHRLVMEMAAPAAEMCWRGLPIDMQRRETLTATVSGEISELEQKLNSEVEKITGKPINARSPKQVKEFLKAKGYRLIVRRGKETTDATALMALQLRYPKDDAIKYLLALSEKNKLFSSYLKPLPYPDNRFRFSLNIHGADTGRWACRKDPWDNGINAQTISSVLKNMFRAPEGWLWLECDLKQADSRFVAWDAPEPTLIKFYNDNVDIHRFVASRPELFNKAIEEITKDERQLGKKVGHASNYGMRGARLSEICLLEMGISLNPQRADQMLEGYHRVFPGIRMWQGRIASEVRRTKKLGTPLGRERYFYDRLGDDLFRVAYAYRPQSTVTDVVNCLIKHLNKHRNPDLLHFALQAHDAAVMLVHQSYLDTAVEMMKAENEWNPKMNLAGGVLQIPIEIKCGEIWGEAKVIHG